MFFFWNLHNILSSKREVYNYDIYYMLLGNMCGSFKVNTENAMEISSAQYLY